ncbi:MAG: phenylalanine--tRNA ligase beta subunit-related protein, partial [Acidobacteriota bacterium]
MKFSLDWLRTHLDLPEPPAEVAEQLASLGFPADSLEPWGADFCLDVEIPANRPDCMCHRGLARELAARLGRELRTSSYKPAGKGEAISELARVKILEPELCPRYSALVLTGVRVGPSPDWIEDRLASIGQRPVNNLVDITNFVLHETGQPLHAFDLDRISGQEIIVRRATKGEQILTLDNVVRELDDSHLVIADAQKPVALAGLMGGASSEIGRTTTRILLESACFAPASIRRAGRSLGLHTEASHRFERGSDRGITLEAALYAAHLILETAGGELAGGAIDMEPRPFQQRRLALRLDRGGALLGMP